MQKQQLLAAAILLLVPFISLQAEENSAIIVTASRIAETAEESLASVTVISREEIERQQARTMRDLLRGVAGLTVTNNGGRGKLTSVFLRGSESDHVLVLVDGVKVGSATLGSAAFQSIPVELIERVEIVRGPRSSLYGSEAIGGVIQIFTRKGGGELKPFFSIEGGSYDTYDGTVGLSGGGDNGWFSVSARGMGTKGFDGCSGDPIAGAGCFVDEPDRDGHKEVSGSVRGGYRFDNGAEFDLHWLRSDGETQFDGAAPWSANESETRQQVFGGTLRFNILDAWQLTLAGGRSQDQTDNLNDSVYMSTFDTERDAYSIQNDITLWEDHLFTLGYDHQEERVNSTTAYTVTSRGNDGVFAQYLGNLWGHDLQASLRHDDNEQFGDHTTGNLGWGYSFHEAFRLMASYGTAFKAPTFNDLYWPGTGNPNLIPEESESIEVGVSGRMDWARWSLNAYQTEVDNLIAWVNTGGWVWTPMNVSKARIRGVEAVLGVHYKGFSMNTQLTLMDPKDRSSGANQGNILPRRARESLRVDLDQEIGDFNIGATVLSEGKRYDDVANTRELDRYTTVDLRAGYQVSKDWRIEGRVENVADKEYETASYFNQPGRSYYLAVRYQPE
jgi:vitamin B12 transporter